MVRANKPYSREGKDNYKRGNPDAGPWKHDLHQNVKQSLASRISNSGGGRPSLLDRISGGQGKELLPTSSSSSSSTKLYGFGEQPPLNPTKPNAGLELLPSSSNGAGPSRRRGNGGSKGRLVDTSLNAALGRNNPRRGNVRPLLTPDASRGAELIGNGNGSGVSIFGAARATIWVRVDNLAQGTSAEDVLSAFAPTPILNAKISSDPDALLVAVDVEVEARSTADEIVSKYNGVVADGNALHVSIVRQGLAERMGRTKAISQPRQRPSPVQSYSQPRGEIYPISTGSSKMYSDSILASDPSASIITLAQEQEMRTQRERANAWQKSGPSLSQRMGGRVGR